MSDGDPVDHPKMSVPEPNTRSKVSAHWLSSFLDGILIGFWGGVAGYGLLVAVELIILAVDHGWDFTSMFADSFVVMMIVFPAPMPVLVGLLFGWMVAYDLRKTGRSPSSIPRSVFLRALWVSLAFSIPSQLCCAMKLIT